MRYRVISDILDLAARGGELPSAGLWQAVGSSRAHVHVAVAQCVRRGWLTRRVERNGGSALGRVFVTITDKGRAALQAGLLS